MAAEPERRGIVLDEHHLFVVVIRAVRFDEAHALPDTTHQELANAQDTPGALSQSIDDYGRIAYTRIVAAVEFADSFEIRNLYNLLPPQWMSSGPFLVDQVVESSLMKPAVAIDLARRLRPRPRRWPQRRPGTGLNEAL
ncbi:MAG: hypothetical protein ABSF26_16545 [Thermoguttaceae bacterium]